jgi:SAM-dependent methyltransferase
MLTVRYETLGLQPGHLLLDAARRGARVVALDYMADEVVQTRATFGAMLEVGEIQPDTYVGGLRGDATRLPFADNSFDRVITSEVLEHIQHDVAAIGELTRVLKPGGMLAATVPTWLPEKISWMLSDEYHAPKSVGGHVRIYSATELKAKFRSAGLDVVSSHHAHALHSPYWWLKCAVGPRNENHPLVAKYRKMLEWEIIKQPRSMHVVERVLSPALGKSFILYGRKPLADTSTIAA